MRTSRLPGLRRHAFCLPLIASLAACGGGGGPSSPGGVTSELNRNQQSTIGQAPTEVSGSASGVADHTPNFGSVTQSTNADADGMTTDRASASYANGKLVVTIERNGKDDLVLKSEDAYATEQTSASGLAGYTIASYGVWNASPEAHTLAALYVGSNDGFTNWLAGGYWLHVSDDGAGASAEAGAFVDGRNLRNAATLPQSGTATYTGTAAGLSAAKTGTDTSYEEGSLILAEFLGDATLNANFGTSTIDGRIDVNRVWQVVTNPAGTEIVDTKSDHPASHEIALISTSITSDGRFEGGVTLDSDELTIASSSGNWGGRFSSVNASDGDPVFAAGTFAGKATSEGNTQIGLVGSFAATK